MTPILTPNSSSPDTQGQDAVVLPDQGQQQDHAGGREETGDDQPPCGWRPANRSAPTEAARIPIVAGVASGRSGSRCSLDFLQVYRDCEEGPLQDQPLDGLGAHAQVGYLVAEQPQRQQHIPALLLLGPDVQEEPQQEQRADSRRTATPGKSSPWESLPCFRLKSAATCRNRRSGTAGARVPRKTVPAADKTAPVRSGRGLGPGWAGSVILRASRMIQVTTRICRPNDARQLIALVTRPPISGPAAAPSPPAPLTTPK